MITKECHELQCYTFVCADVLVERRTDPSRLCARASRASPRGTRRCSLSRRPSRTRSPPSRRRTTARRSTSCYSTARSTRPPACAPSTPPFTASAPHTRNASVRCYLLRLKTSRSGIVAVRLLYNFCLMS